MVRIVPAPTGASLVVVIHNPLQPLDVFVDDLLNVLVVFGFKFGLKR